MILLLLGLAFAVEPGCLVIHRPQVFAEDLATRLPEFRRLPAGAALTASPVFGTRRDLSSSTLRSWVQSYGVEAGELEPLCLYRSAASVHDIAWEAELREALDSLFGLKPGPAEIEILEQTIAPGPPGKLSLERSGLSFDPQRQQYLWRGRLTGSGSYAAVRIRFAFHRRQTRLITARPLSAGRVLGREDISSVEEAWRPGGRSDEILVEPPLGKVLRRSLPKGTIIEPLHLTEATLIQQGDAVELSSTAGEATIRISGIARSKARLGDPLLISTLEGKKLLRAIAVGPGKVEIQSGTGKRNK
jgi:flagella basal body P-ring formation protein FlgA